MIATRTDRRRLDEVIDPAYSPETSVVCRYRHAFSSGAPEEDSAFKAALLDTSIREGARIFPLLTYRGVDLHVLDESSLMQTGTLKSIDGCLTAAKCRLRGYERVVFESGGNTGTALTAYGQKAGLETFCFVPEASVPLLDSRVFERETAHLIAVADAGLVKESARLFRGVNRIQHIPEVAWRYEASRFRGCFILEHSMRHGGFDWLVQTISAAFGPIGIYGVLHGFESGLDRIPRFLGIQQEANCPMYKAWTSDARELGPAGAEPKRGGDLLTRVMYDVAPHTYGTYADLKGVLEATRGDLGTINHQEFFDMFEQRFDGKSILDLLEENAARIGTRNGDVIERTGLIALAGALKAISENRIARGSRVLCCLTSGTRPGDGRAVPDYRVTDVGRVLQDCHRMLHGA
ncbi:MAG: pyridoxal-phosphate dependent enzyme [Zetaproteobacteria bacterium]|nr:MAG: pyridoxal-phosphate dependent enzyme [Zetaproteobacteria bacterium]